MKPPSSSRPDEVSWEWFGAAKDDPSWEALFVEIEQHREATRQAE
jgi:hypothetical protein